MQNIGLLTDRQIKELCINVENPMLDPFIPIQAGKPSYGLGSCGYDLRLGENFLTLPHNSRKHVNRIPNGQATTFLDPLKDGSDLWVQEHHLETIVLQPHEVVLAESVEWFNMPEDVSALVFGKSTYARTGLLVNAVPIEVSWRGRLTLELCNLAPLPLVLHIGQGIAQVVFFRTQRPERTYIEKEAGGRYHEQKGVMPAGGIYEPELN